MICKNCHNTFTDTSDYCNTCGAKVIRNRLTIKNLAQDISEQYLDYDNKFLQTFITLFKNPEKVIGSYIHGTRKKYVNVISYFAIAITLSGIQIYVMNKYGIDLSGIAENENAAIAELQNNYNSKMFEIISEYQSLIMMLWIPIYALMAKLVFLKNKLYNYTELIVIFMYAQAQYSIVTVVLTLITIVIGIPFEIFGLLMLPVQIGYFAFCLKRVYGLDKAQIILKTLIFILILGVLFGIIMVVVTFMMFKTGMMDEVIEAQKALQEAQKAAKDSIP